MNNETVKAVFQVVAVVVVTIGIAIWGYTGSTHVVGPTQAWEQATNLKAEISAQNK